MKTSATSDAQVSRALAPFGTSIFGEMSALAREKKAINLSQGFPDFEGPSAIVEAAVAALREGKNQYARSQGELPLAHAIAAHQEKHYGLTTDPLREVTTTTGCTEAIAATLLGLLNDGDEVIAFEPVYDSYPALCALARAKLVPVTLRFPAFALDEEALRKAVTPKTRVILLNSPHNPTGKVFSRAELECIASVCLEHDLIAVCDSVYEHLTYDDAEHIPLAAIDGMRERTLTLSSSGKTWSFTGWKVGWAVGPAHLIAATQAAHQFLTFSGAAPLQHGIAHALEHHQGPYLETLRRDYQARRDFLVEVLREVGLKPAVPAGTYFVLADFGAVHDGDDVSFARHLIDAAQVACIPPSSFYVEDKAEGAHLVRFAFCKRQETLDAAAAKLRAWAKAGA